MAALRENCTVLGFTGTLGSGKDFVADMARRHLFPGETVQNVSFADLLKFNTMLLGEDDYGGSATAALCGGNATLDMVEERYTDFFSAKPEHVRRQMQNYGERLRSKHPKVWVHGLYAHMLHQHRVNGVTVFLISDLRFPKEAEFVQEVGGTVIKVHAPRRSAGVGSGYTDPAVKAHISETLVEMISADYTLDNDNSTFDELLSKLRELTAGMTGSAASTTTAR